MTSDTVSVVRKIHYNIGDESKTETVKEPKRHNDQPRIPGRDKGGDQEAGRETEERKNRRRWELQRPR